MEVDLPYIRKDARTTIGISGIV